MSVVYRPARADDLTATDALVVASINDRTVRADFAASAPSFQLFSLEDGPDGLGIAESGDDVLGFAWRWVEGCCCW